MRLNFEGKIIAIGHDSITVEHRLDSATMNISINGNQANWNDLKAGDYCELQGMPVNGIRVDRTTQRDRYGNYVDNHGDAVRDSQHAEGNFVRTVPDAPIQVGFNPNANPKQQLQRDAHGNLYRDGYNPNANQYHLQQDSQGNVYNDGLARDAKGNLINDQFVKDAKGNIKEKHG